jgi:hypothetical protein
MQREVYDELMESEDIAESHELIVEPIAEKVLTNSKNKCPECGEDLQFKEGCVSCGNCFYSKCG